MESDHERPAGLPRTIKASEFKAKCLKLMDEVAETGEEIVITKNGRPVSKLVPCEEAAGDAGSGGIARHHPDPRRHRRTDAQGVVG